jgi:hypothetical protein
MLSGELARLVEGNAWTYGPVATALRVLDLTVAERADPAAFWEPLLEASPRMAPLGYWHMAHRMGGWKLDALRDDSLRRARLLLDHLDARLPETGSVLLIGHDLEIDLLLERPRPGREHRYLLLDGGPAPEAPGDYSRRRYRPRTGKLGPPFDFTRLEEALDWADTVVLAGFVMHRQNVLGPPQLRPILSSAREQVDRVFLCALNERRLTLGEGAPRRYTDDFRPYLWQAGATHLLSEWHSGAEGTSLGWLPVPLEVLQGPLGESLFLA